MTPLLEAGGGGLQVEAAVEKRAAAGVAMAAAAAAGLKAAAVVMPPQRSSLRWSLRIPPGTCPARRRCISRRCIRWGQCRRRMCSSSQTGRCCTERTIPGSCLSIRYGSSPPDRKDNLIARVAARGQT